MASLIQDLGLVDDVIQDVVGFAGGKFVATTIDGYGVSVVVLPSGPAAPYITLPSSIISIVLTVISEYATFASGAPVALAIKEGTTWYGVTLTPKAAA